MDASLLSTSEKTARSSLTVAEKKMVLAYYTSRTPLSAESAITDRQELGRTEMRMGMINATTYQYSNKLSPKPFTACIANSRTHWAHCMFAIVADYVDCILEGLSTSGQEVPPLIL